MLGIVRSYILSQAILKNRLILTGFLVVYAALLIAGCNDYVLWRSPLVWGGLFILGYLSTTNKSGQRRFTTRYFYPAIVFIILTVLLPVKTFLYFSLAFGVLLLIDSMYIRLSHLHFLVLIIVAPIFNYFIAVFTFPIRLQLSQLTVQMLSHINSSVQQNGSSIEINKADFSVDAACMGLNMVSMGLLIGVFLLGYYQKQTKAPVTFLHTGLFLSCIFLFVILSNVFRIAILVLFAVSQEALMHELIGDVCFIVYVIFPATVWVQWKIKRQRKRELQVNQRPGGNAKFTIAKNSIVVLGLVIATVNVLVQKAQSNGAASIALPDLPGYKIKAVDKDILALENSDVLIYVKHINSFYSTEHSPMICWKGSGYKLEKIKVESIEGLTVYTSALTSGTDILYTCWWFDNGKYQTVDQLDWRWKVLRGSDDFSVINITSASRRQLEQNIAIARNTDVVGRLLRQKF